VIKQVQGQHGGAESGRCQSAAHDALPTALALHGAGGGAWEWSCWARAWSAAGGQFVAADFSRQAAEQNCRISPLLRDLAERHRDDVGGVLIGASFGALLACALARPLRAAALVLLNPLPPAPFHRIGVEQKDGAEAAPDSMRRWGLTACPVGTQAALPELQASESSLAFRRWTDFSRGLLAEARAGIAVERPDCPVLVVHSVDDQEIDPRALEVMVSRWRTSHLRLPGSHVSPLLGKRWFEAFGGVRAWLAGIRGF
jgi:pimeloyl-ACP methyl ester carboxylesterase